ncbi:MAG: ankyrin repeat domain-containing protein [Paracoccaceae bacterium]|nr:ankyrin repeat domain-containing protein [Paracoccaceae bacterium]
MLRIAVAFFLLSVSGSIVFAGPLYDATVDGDLEKVRALIDAGADPDAQGGNGETPLTTALVGGHLSMASLLIDLGADIQGRNRGGFAPLHAAAFAGAAEIAALLLDRGADVNDQANKAGVTALSIASEEGHVGVAQVLIDHGADVEAAEQNGYTPLTRAIWRGQQAVVSLLQQRGARCQPIEILEEPAYSECVKGQP